MSRDPMLPNHIRETLPTSSMARFKRPSPECRYARTLAPPEQLPRLFTGQGPGADDKPAKGCSPNPTIPNQIHTFPSITYLIECSADLLCTNFSMAGKQPLASNLHPDMWCYALPTTLQFTMSIICPTLDERSTHALLKMLYFRVWGLLVILALSSHTNATCYTPRGAIAESDLPCDTTAAESVCCPVGSTCSANKVCMINDEPYRGSCTDKSFNSPACTNFCSQGGAGSFRNTPVQMTLCNTGPNWATYCCNKANREPCDCSANSSRKVVLGLPVPIKTLLAVPQGSCPTALSITITAPVVTYGLSTASPIDEVTDI